MKRKEWSDWISFQEKKLEEVPSSSGVYQLSSVINGHTQPIHRVDGIDENGLLYIGKTKNLKSRIRGFWRYITSEKGNNTAGFTYIFYDYERKFKPDQLQVRWMLLPEDEIDEIETKLLDDYLNKYLDSPPLNISIKRPY